MGIRKMLFHNEIGPGQKISYRDLSERLQMSQTPVIQALKWLEFQQLVIHKRNRGYYTARISLKEVEEIFELRELIEVWMLSKTIKRSDTEGLQRLAQALKAHKRASREVYLYDRLLKDMAFHLALAEMAGCAVQLQSLQNLFDLLYLKYGGSILFSTSLEASYADHQQLYQHVKDRNATGARGTLTRHLRRVKKHALSGLTRIIKEKQNTKV